MRPRSRWLLVVLFALAMAWMESATVTYLRTLLNRVNPYTADPIPANTSLRWIEMGREVATLLMLLSVGWLAGRNWRTRFSYLLIAWGVWDIAYYVFLAVMGPWPRSLLDWDVLFLLPLPWWGPVLAPTAIAFLMIIGGSLVTQSDRPDFSVWPGRWSVTVNIAGILLALIVFMRDAIRALPQGWGAVAAVLPTSFNWIAFAAALLMMSVSVFDVALQIWRGPRLRHSPPLARGASQRA